MFGNSTIAKLQKNSEKIVSVFTKTITELTTVNQEVDKNIQTRQTEIDRMMVEQQELQTIKDSNTKMIDKLNKLFE